MTTDEHSAPTAPSPTALAVFSWLWVGLPTAYGLYELTLKAVQLFTGG